MTQATPTQELAAKDLHGFEWKFKHIYRGNFDWTLLWFALKAKWSRHGSYILSTNVIRSTKKTLAYNWLEYICRNQKIGRRRRICFPKVFIQVLMLSMF